MQGQVVMLESDLPKTVCNPTPIKHLADKQQCDKGVSA